MLASIFPMLNDETLYDCISNQTDLVKFKVSIRYTNAYDKELLVEDDDKTAVKARSDSNSEEGGNQFLYNLFKSSNNGDIYMD